MKLGKQKRQLEVTSMLKMKEKTKEIHPRVCVTDHMGWHAPQTYVQKDYYQHQGDHKLLHWMKCKITHIELTLYITAKLLDALLTAWLGPLALVRQELDGPLLCVGAVKHLPQQACVLCAHNTVGCWVQNFRKCTL